MDRPRVDGGRGERSGPAELAASLHTAPRASSERLGWKNVAVCCWRAEVDEYALRDTPDTLIALHTEGLVEQYARHDWGADRSVPGQVSILPPGTSARFRNRGMLGVTTIHLDRPRLEALVGGDDARRALDRLPLRVGIVDPLIAAAMTALADALRRPGTHAAQYADAIADTLALHVLRSAAPLPPPRVAGGLPTCALRRVQDRVEAGLANRLTIDDLARETGLSSYHFSRAFRATTGLTPHRYVLERRIARAKALLRDSDMPIAEVALSVGFSSQTHLTDCFRRLVGTSPGEYRRAH
jgi:AraC family transcriptional regulator